jgi:hypothetical protein
VTEAFEADWLALREAADGDARDDALTAHAGRWLAGRGRPARIVDLGAGAGNNPAWLAPRLPGPQRWRLVDHDAGLLARAARRLVRLRDADGQPVALAADRRDLDDVGGALPADTDLATASALFDLVSPDWLERLAERCAAVGCAVLWTLSVDGRWRFVDAAGVPLETAEDAAMCARLNAHQRRDKGLGSALGGAAPAALVSAFERRGFRVRSADSPWRLAAGRSVPLALALIDGWRTALCEIAPEAADEIDAWSSDRRSRIERGELGIDVGHVDVWGEPA